MEPENDGLVQMIFLFNWVIFRFQPLIFRGEILAEKCSDPNKPGLPDQVGAPLPPTPFFWSRPRYPLGPWLMVDGRWLVEQNNLKFKQ